MIRTARSIITAGSQLMFNKVLKIIVSSSGLKHSRAVAFDNRHSKPEARKDGGNYKRISVRLVCWYTVVGFVLHSVVVSRGTACMFFLCFCLFVFFCCFSTILISNPFRSVWWRCPGTIARQVINEIMLRHVVVALVSFCVVHEDVLFAFKHRIIQPITLETSVNYDK